MTFPSIEDPIQLQPGILPYDFTASGAILKGQGVAFCNSGLVYVPDVSTQRLIGIAGYQVDDGEEVQIYGLFNLVRCNLTGSQSVGTLVGLVSDGYLANTSKYPVSAIVMKGTTSTGEGEVLLI